MRIAWARRAWDEHRAGYADQRLFLWTWLSLQHTVESLAIDHREKVPA
jgi:hypothetical protein